MDTFRLVSVQVGMPREMGREGADDPMDEPWQSGIFKAAVAGPVWLGATGLVGDGQADTRHHGGPEQAALAYGADHYSLWRAEPGMAGVPVGGFGENLTIAGLCEDTVCIGDTYAVGEGRVQVSQPRTPCWKLERRLRVPGLVECVTLTGWTGWYFRVLAPGNVEAGDEVALLERPCPQWTITRVHAVMRGRRDDPAAAAALAACPYLSPRWRQALGAPEGAG